MRGPMAQAQAWQPVGGATPTRPAVNPMATHVKVVAVIEIVFASLLALGALVLLFAFGVGTAVTGSQDEVPGFVPGIIASLGLLFVGLLAAVAILGFVGGMGLLNGKRSGKVPTFIFAGLSLLSIPFGTAYGIYAIVILTRPDTDRLLA